MFLFHVVSSPRQTRGGQAHPGSQEWDDVVFPQSRRCAEDGETGLTVRTATWFTNWPGDMGNTLWGVLFAVLSVSESGGGGGGNVEIAGDFQGRGEGWKSPRGISRLSTVRHFHGPFILVRFLSPPAGACSTAGETALSRCPASPAPRDRSTPQSTCRRAAASRSAPAPALRSGGSALLSI